MKLEFIGHDERYAIEQLQMSLFPEYIHEEIGETVSKLSRGAKWLTATTIICLAIFNKVSGGKSVVDQ
mgnify:CR=1 FL=1